MEKSLKELKEYILSNKKRQRAHQILLKLPLKLNQISVSLMDLLSGGEIGTYVRNENCTKISCVYDFNEIVQEIQKEIHSRQSFQVKCKECQANLDQSKFFVDLDMEEAVQKLKNDNYDAFQELSFGNSQRYEIQVDKKNEWILKDKELNTITVLKESDMLTEYEKNYPTYPSQQSNPQFYENGYVFVNANVDVQKNQKLQSVLYLFFPSLASNRWKEVIIYLSHQHQKQAFFQKYMSVCKIFNKIDGQHSILASGGFGYPEEAKYEQRTFEVKLFTNDPENQIPKHTDLIPHNQMIKPRVFHQLIQYQDKIYALGGYSRQNNTDIPLQSCERFNIVTKKWEQISDLTHPRQLFTTLVYQNLLFVIGGRIVNEQQQEEEDLTVEFFDESKNTWTLTYIFQYQNPQKYFTERSFCFAKDNNTIVVFGGRKEKTNNNSKPCERSRTAAELNLSTGKHQLTQDLLPPYGITFEGATDFQGIYYNNRFIFGFKRQGNEDNKEYLYPSICKYNELSKTDKFSFEQYKKIV